MIGERATGSQTRPAAPAVPDTWLAVFALAAGFGLVGALGLGERSMALAWWLATVLTLTMALPLGLLAVVEWAGLERVRGAAAAPSPESVALALGSALLAAALLTGPGLRGPFDGEVPVSALGLSLSALAALAAGRWLAVQRVRLGLGDLLPPAPALAVVPQPEAALGDDAGLPPAA